MTKYISLITLLDVKVVYLFETYVLVNNIIVVLIYLSKHQSHAIKESAFYHGKTEATRQQDNATGLYDNT